MAGFNADTPAGAVVSRTVTLVEGSSFCISSANGDINPEYPHGVFHEDTRILSRWNLTVNGQPLEPLTAEVKEPYRARFACRVPRRDGYADSPLIVERVREVAAGILEEITVWNHSLHSAECTVVLSVESDFADLFEVKEAHVRRRWEESRQPDGESLTLRATWQDVRKDVVVKASGARISADALTYRVTVPPHGHWSTALTVVPAVDGKDPAALIVRPASGQMSPRDQRRQEWVAKIPVLHMGNQSIDRTLHAPFLYRTQFHSSTPEEETQRALEHLETLIQLEGPSTIAAVILESIPGTAGIMVPPPGYLQGVRELATKYGIIYIADEVMCGFGRSEKWFAIDHFDVVPDLLTFAKGVNSGYVPLGGVAISPEIAATFGQRAYPGGLTYSGHPLATAAAVATINAMRDEGIVENAAQLGADVFAPGLAALQEKHQSVGEVRGAGAFWAIELVKDRQTREPLAPYGASSPEMNELIAACRTRGLLPFANFNRIHVVPPLNISVEDANRGLSILDEVLDIADAKIF